MSDSLSPDNRNPLDEEAQPQGDPTPTQGFVHQDMANPEQGLGSPQESLAGEPGQEDPAHIHQRRLESTGGISPADSGNAVPELSSDDQSLLTGNPPGAKPM